MSLRQIPGCVGHAGRERVCAAHQAKALVAPSTSAAAAQSSSSTPTSSAPDGDLLTAVLDVAGAAVKGAVQSVSDVLSVLACYICGQ